MNNFKRPIVSICVITYNQEPFIKQAIESLLMQECDFSFEIVIGEDYSSDGTRKTCEAYAHNYPDIIRILHSERNLGMNLNFIRTLDACLGKYIAICEGDDYWTDPDKLRKQVEILENHENYSACITNGHLIDENDEFIRLYLNGIKEGCLPAEFLIHRGGASYPTASILFRNSLGFTDILSKIPELAGDNLLIMILAMQGKIYYIDLSTCNYRIWEGGVYTRTINNEKKTIQRRVKTIDGLIKLLKISKKPYRRYLKKRISQESLLVLQNVTISNSSHFMLNLNFKDSIKFLYLRISKVIA